MRALSLPAGLATLRLHNLSFAIGDLALPAALTHLELGLKFSDRLGSVRWPRGLRSLQLSYSGYAWSRDTVPLSLPDVDSRGHTGLPQTLTLIKLIVVGRSRFDEEADAWRSLVTSCLPQCRLEPREEENQ